MSGNSAVKVTLNHSWLNKVIACVKYIDSYVSSGNHDLFKGLFRIPARESTLSDLKARIGSIDASQGIDTTLDCLQDFHQTHSSDNDGVNAVASLLKWILREFPVALLPFDYATADLQKKNHHKVIEENERGMLGCKFAQDLILTMASQLSSSEELDVGESISELIAHAIAAVAQMLSMLCTVARINEIAMPRQNLFIVFLPSLCNSRDPMVLMEESKKLVELNAHRRQIERNTNVNNAGEIQSQELPVYRFEVHIMFGHRIWGYIEHSLPSLVLALETIAELTAEMSPPERQHRKRDILKRLLNKMRGKSVSHDINNDSNDREKSPNAFKRGFKKLQNKIHKNKAPNLHLDEKMYSNTGETGDNDGKFDEYEEYLGELALLTKSPRFGEEHVKRLAIQRAESLSITSSLVGQWGNDGDSGNDITDGVANQIQDQQPCEYEDDGSKTEYNLQAATSNKILSNETNGNSSRISKEELGNVGKSLLACEFFHSPRRKSERGLTRFDSTMPIQAAHYVSSPDLIHRDV